MKKALLTIILILVLGIPGLFSAVANEAVITDFTAYDMPDDDGSGIILKWKPLPKEHRIIKYNIYRGVSPDSLFLLTHLEVDPKLGVLAPYLYYYDTGDKPLIEFETSPMKLRKEKGQAPDSPLYQKFPIQPDIITGRIRLIAKADPFAINRNPSLFDEFFTAPARSKSSSG